MSEITPGVPDAESLLEQLPRIRSLACDLVGEHRADDVTQEVWLRASKSEAPVRSLSAWLGGIARNVALQMHRSERRRRAREQRAATPELVDPEPPPAVVLEAHARLVEAIHRLPGPLQRIVYLKYFESLDATSIAHRIGVPKPTVRSQLQRALELLRRDLGRRDHDGRVARGLAVLVAGAQNAPGPLTATGAASILGGVIVSLKSIVSIAAIALLALAVWWWQQDPPSSPSEGSGLVVDERSKTEDAGIALLVEATTSDQQVPGDPKPVWSGEVKAGGVLGIVQDGATGSPISGAEVFLSSARGQHFLEPTEEALLELRAVTGDDGRFEFEGLDAQRKFACRAEIDGLMVAARPTTVGEFLCLEVFPLRELRVTVDAEGQPSRWVEVYVTCEDTELWRERRKGIESEILAQVPRGKGLMAHATDERGRHASSVVGEDQESVALYLERKLRITGTVWSPEGGAVAGASVSARRSGTPGVVTDRFGKFVLEGIGPQREGLVVYAEAEGHAGGQTTMNGLSEDTTTHVRLPSTLKISGWCRDGETGSPVADARVAIFCYALPRGAYALGWESAISDENGSFSIRVRDDSNQVLMVRKEGYGTVLRDLDVLSIAERSRDSEAFDIGKVDLLPPATIRGYIHTDENVPLGDCSVQLSYVDASRSTLFEIPERERTVIRPLRATATSGEFVFTNLAGGKYSVELRFSDVLERVREFVVCESGKETVLEVTKPTAGRQVVGVVTYDGGEPAEGARVGFFDRRNGNSGSCTTDSAGRFAVQLGLERGEYRVSASPERSLRGVYGSQQVEISEFDGELSFSLPRLVQVTGVVIREDGDPIRGRTFSAVDEVSGPEYQFDTDMRGHFEARFPLNRRLQITGYKLGAVWQGEILIGPTDRTVMVRCKETLSQ